MDRRCPPRCTASATFALLLVAALPGGGLGAAQVPVPSSPPPVAALLAGGNVCDVRDAGARGDNQTDDSAALQAAIDGCRAAHPLGAVVHLPGPNRTFPTATYRITTSIALGSNLTVALGANAGIFSAWTPALHPAAQHPRCPTLYWPRGPTALLCGTNLSNVALVGAGVGRSVVDGGGWPWYLTGVANKSMWGQGPRLFELAWSTNVTLARVSLVNSPSWTVHPTFCRGVLAESIAIINPRFTPNTDGFDPDSSANVVLRDSLIDTGDDGISIKSSNSSACGRPCAHIPVPARDIYIHNTTILSRNVCVGSATFGGVYNLLVEDCTIGDDDGSSPWAIKYKSHQAYAGAMVNHTWRRLRVGRIAPNDYQQKNGGYFMSIELRYHPLLPNRTCHVNREALAGDCPIFSNVSFEDIAVTGAARAGDLNGFDGDLLHGLSFRNVTFKEAPKQGWTCGYTDLASFSQVAVDPPITCSAGPTGSGGTASSSSSSSSSSSESGSERGSESKSTTAAAMLTTTTGLPNGAIWHDSQGDQIEAHGGTILKIAGVYHWYGASKKLPLDPATGLPCGFGCSMHVRLYTSTDLLRWTFVATVFNASEIRIDPDLKPYAPAPPFRIERPKVRATYMHAASLPLVPFWGFIHSFTLSLTPACPPPPASSRAPPPAARPPGHFQCRHLQIRPRLPLRGWPLPGRVARRRLVRLRRRPLRVGGRRARERPVLDGHDGVRVRSLARSRRRRVLSRLLLPHALLLYLISTPSSHLLLVVVNQVHRPERPGTHRVPCAHGARGAPPERPVDGRLAAVRRLPVRCSGAGVLQHVDAHRGAGAAVPRRRVLPVRLAPDGAGRQPGARAALRGEGAVGVLHAAGRADEVDGCVPCSAVRWWAGAAIAPCRVNVHCTPLSPPPALVLPPTHSLTHSRYSLARSPDLGNPAVGPGTNPEGQGPEVTFNSQSTAVVPLDGEPHGVVALWMGDVWGPDPKLAPGKSNYNATYAWFNLVASTPANTSAPDLTFKWANEYVPGAP